MAWIMPMLGMGSAGPGTLPGAVSTEWRAVAVLAAGALGAAWLPRFQTVWWIAAGLGAWLARNPQFAWAFAAAVVALGAARRRPALALGFLALAGFVAPKTWFSLHHDVPHLHGWLDESGTTLFILGALYYWRERIDGRIGQWTMPEWTAFFLFPSNCLNPINIAPSDFAGRRAPRPLVAQGWRALGLAALKGGALVLLATVAGGFWYSRWTVEGFEARAAALGSGGLWLALGATHAACVLWLSATADVAVAIGRFFGLDLPSNYRWALLAWNPVELWRRWAIYNRRLLLKLVYFPLGGRGPRQFLNILATFLASALVLHTGWFGSKYWTVGGDMVGLFCAYFLGQGLTVCACVAWWRRTGKDPGSDRRLRFSSGRVFSTLLTQAFAAWLHLLILCPPGVPWDARVRVMARALGW